MIYFDNASTTQVGCELKDVICNYTFGDYGNPGSIHSLGKKSKTAITESRSKIAKALNTKADNIIFTSCGSEANTLGIIGLSNYLLSRKLTHIITTKYEHHSILNSMKEMERRGFEVTYLDVKNGVVSCDELIAAIRDNTGLVSVMYVNNELGSVNRIQQIYSICKGKGILFHSDCVQALGTVPINMENTADLISLSGHKIHAPKGIGCLCIKDKNLLSNIIYGGEQEFGLRPGTENVPNIIAFGIMVKKATTEMRNNLYKIQSVSMHFGAELMNLCNANGIKYHFNSPECLNSPKILSVRFDGIEAETLVLMLSSKGLCAGTGSACSNNSVKPSHVLKAIGLSDEEARSTVRFSFSVYNTVDEAKEAAKMVVDCIQILKVISPQNILKSSLSAN